MTFSTINKMCLFAHKCYTSSYRMIPSHCYLTDYDHVLAVVKSLRSIDSLPSLDMFLHFPNSPKSSCNNNINRRKIYQHPKSILHPNREQINNGIWFNKFISNSEILSNKVLLQSIEMVKISISYVMVKSIITF